MKGRDAVKALKDLTVLVFVLGLVPVTRTVSFAASKRDIDRNATTAVNSLLKSNPKAKDLANKSVGVLIFPSIVKGGFIIAGQFGDGVLRKHGKSVAYYRSLAASYGFQAGAQAFGYALFFMDDDSIAYLDKSGGFELGSGPSLVVLDSGFGKNMSTTTLQKGIYAMIFKSERIDGWNGDPRHQDYEDQPGSIT